MLILNKKLKVSMIHLKEFQAFHQYPSYYPYYLPSYYSTAYNTAIVDYPQTYPSTHSVNKSLDYPGRYDRYYQPTDYLVEKRQPIIDYTFYTFDYVKYMLIAIIVFLFFRYTMSK